MITIIYLRIYLYASYWLFYYDIIMLCFFMSLMHLVQWKKYKYTSLLSNHIFLLGIALGSHPPVFWMVSYKWSSAYENWWSGIGLSEILLCDTPRYGRHPTAIQNSQPKQLWLWGHFSIISKWCDPGGDGWWQPLESLPLAVSGHIVWQGIICAQVLH